MIRARWPILVRWLLAVMISVGLPWVSTFGGEPTNTDARIAYYQARIGGPGTYPAYARLGLAFLQKARETGQRSFYTRGLDNLRKSLSYQRSFEALFGLAFGLSEHHHFQEALGYAREALEAMPGSIEALGVLFDIHLAVGQVDQAGQTLKRMFQAPPGFDAWTRQAALREYQGDLGGALEALTKAITFTESDSKRPIRAWAEVRIGSLHAARCEAAAAREAYERALALLPGFYLAKEHLAEWHAAQGQWREAEVLLKELLAKRPEPQYRLLLAEVDRRQQKVQEASKAEAQALTELRAAVQEEPEEQSGLLATILLDRREGAAEALKLATREWAARKDALSADRLAWAYWKNGQREDALRLSAEALRSGTKQPIALLHAGIIRTRSGQAEEGRRLIDQALACPLALGPFAKALAEQTQTELSQSR